MSPKAPAENPLVGLLLRETLATLRTLSDLGCRGFEAPPMILETLDRLGRPPAPLPETLEAIRADIGPCTRCRLHAGRQHIVFGEGDPKARLMFIGEGPGYDEDRAGRPFVGQAGQLLNRIIQAIKLTREQVYIANVVKCHPPANRAPEPEEIRTCLPFLKRQIAAVSPAFICTLGNIATQSLLGTGIPISRIRGQWQDFGTIPVLPTYHPAFLLRNPEKKREVWDDMKGLMRAMGIPL